MHNICHIVFPEWLERTRHGRDQSLHALWDAMRLVVCMKRAKDGVFVVTIHRQDVVLEDEPIFTTW